MTWRSMRPSRSSSLSAFVNIREEISGTSLRISLNRFGVSTKDHSMLVFHRPLNRSTAGAMGHLFSSIVAYTDVIWLSTENLVTDWFLEYSYFTI